MTTADETTTAALRALYHDLLDGWAKRDGAAMAAPFAEDGEIIGFDGSQHAGRSEIARQMQQIFDDHQTAAYVGKVRGVRMLGADAALVHAVAGMVPPGADDIEPKLNTIQTLVAARTDGRWEIVLYQNTPAQYHQAPAKAAALTDELRAVLRG